MDWDKAPSLTAVISYLQGIRDEVGNLPVCLKDPDTKDCMRIGALAKRKDLSRGLPARVEITADYLHNPKGLVGEKEDD